MHLLLLQLQLVMLHLLLREPRVLWWCLWRARHPALCGTTTPAPSTGLLRVQSCPKHPCARQSQTQQRRRGRAWEAQWKQPDPPAWH
jgi:hypothetical protein